MQGMSRGLTGALSDTEEALFYFLLSLPQAGHHTCAQICFGGCLWEILPEISPKALIIY